MTTFLLFFEFVVKTRKTNFLISPANFQYNNRQCICIGDYYIALYVLITQQTVYN